MPVKHKFQSARPDNGDPGAIQPSNFNDYHELSGMLAALDAFAPSPNTVVTLGGDNQIFLEASANFARLFSPQFTGVPLAPTPNKALAGNQIATMEVVHTLITDLIGGAPGALDTLNELAASLNNDAAFSATVTASLAVRLRVDAVQGLTSGQKAQGVANLGLATVAVSGNYADLAGRPSLATVATSGSYSDLANKPALGTAAPLNVGTAANQIVQLDGNGKLPAVDGSQLTNLALRGYLAGLTLSTAGASASFGISAGVAADSASAVLMSLPAAYTKTTAPWAVGTGNGALDTGAIAANTWYHVYPIKRPDTGVVDICISVNPNAPTLGAAIPAAYTLFRRIGSMRTNASSQWVKFFQVGDEFVWDVVANDVGASNPGTVAALRTLSVPPGFKVLANIGGMSASPTSGAFDGRVMISPPDASDEVASQQSLNVGLQGVSGVTTSFSMRVMTNTAQQIRTKNAASDAATVLVIGTRSWVDRRGRDD